ncbi:OmpA family protein [Thermoflavifilum thermophilum]|uniref:OmpA family protein n=1 Tax=Thermoflavifilum thermophilum TaxID=1393122 RepID=A0A1I7MZI4_9BACT|nr:OmpA family protein [Thermoflavifilum thermophilum]SFV27736.1 OmpA family protein [Thermoflavifilum thermophilum]
MRKSYFFNTLIGAIVVIIIGNTPAQAQFLKKLGNQVKEAAQQGVEQAATNHAVNDAGNTTDKAISKGENAIKDIKKNKSNNNNSANNSENNNTSANTSTLSPESSASAAEGEPTLATFTNYDFVPGDSIIFESNLADEQSGEIPSQFTLLEGQMDVQNINGENVIRTVQGGTITFTPRMTTTSYMPDQFTVEFDIMNQQWGLNHFNIDFGHRVYYSGGEGILPGIRFGIHDVTWSDINITGTYPEPLDKLTNGAPMKWHHVAIAINKTQGKVYIDQYRVLNVNNLTGKPNNVTFNVSGYEDSYIKNIRVAAGGIDIYKKITTESRIIMHGILFDVDKATLKPESMGSINQIFNLMQKDPSLKFEIDGHTDNTGNAAHNLTLSQQRADAVKEQLVKMGIDASRLTTKGFGDTKPIDTNDTPEGKANNRRVEFVKM